MTTMTGDQLQAILDETATAVRDYYGTGADIRHVHAEVRRALRVGHSVAAIAARAGLRQLLVARLVEDRDQRATALAAARHDAERYAEHVRAAIKGDVVAALADGVSEAQTARIYGVTRKTVRDWRSELPVEPASQERDGGAHCALCSTRLVWRFRRGEPEAGGGWEHASPPRDPHEPAPGVVGGLTG